MSKEQDEREAKELAVAMYNAAWPSAPWCHGAIEQSLVRAARFILARQAEREGMLVGALETDAAAFEYSGHSASARRVRDVLARWRALNAPPQRTLADVADRALLDMRVPKDVRDELAEALKREEGKR